MYNVTFKHERSEILPTFSVFLILSINVVYLKLKNHYSFLSCFVVHNNKKSVYNTLLNAKILKKSVCYLVQF